MRKWRPRSLVSLTHTEMWRLPCTVIEPLLAEMAGQITSSFSADNTAEEYNIKASRRFECFQLTVCLSGNEQLSLPSMRSRHISEDRLYISTSAAAIAHLNGTHFWCMRRETIVLRCVARNQRRVTAVAKYSTLPEDGRFYDARMGWPKVYVSSGFPFWVVMNIQNCVSRIIFKTNWLSVYINTKPCTLG